jgi:hypothetical protein
MKSEGKLMWQEKELCAGMGFGKVIGVIKLVP